MQPLKKTFSISFKICAYNKVHSTHIHDVVVAQSDPFQKCIDDLSAIETIRCQFFSRCKLQFTNTHAYAYNAIANMLLFILVLCVWRVPFSFSFVHFFLKEYICRGFFFFFHYTLAWKPFHPFVCINNAAFVYDQKCVYIIILYYS